MATATQTDDELIILEDDAPAASTEEVIDFNEAETADTLVKEAEAPVETAETPAPVRKLKLGSLFGGSKKEEAAEEAPVEDSQEIVNLGESLETTLQASDLFSEDTQEEAKTEEALGVSEDASEETSELSLEETSVEVESTEVESTEVEESSETAVEPEVSLEADTAEETVDLFGEAETTTDEVSLVVDEAVETSELDLLSDATDVATEQSSETAVEPEVSLEADTAEETVDLFGEAETTTDEVSLLEDDSFTIGGDDSSTGDDATVGDDESMNTILGVTIAKLEARKEAILKDKDADKAQITDRKTQIKELQKEIKEFEGTIAEDTAEQTKITNNVKKLKTMKSSEEVKV